MNIHFASPLWFWALAGLIPLFTLRLWSHFRSGKNLTGLVSPRLHTRLISGSNIVQRWLSFIFLSLALAFTIVAMARPQWGFEESATESEARNLIIAIDTSRSMLATDLVPNRMARAKLAAQDIVNGLPDDRIGVLAFAGKAFLQAPLTVDHDAVIEAIDQLDTEIIPRGGTNLSEAVKLALGTFKEAEIGRSALVIFSDGESLEGSDAISDLKKDAAENSMAIVTIGVGSRNGAIIPEYDQSGNIIPGVFVMDDAGQVVRSRLDPAALQSLASGGGVYVHLGGNAALGRVVEKITGLIEASRNEEEAQMRPIERFMWPLGIGFALMILSFLTPLFFVRRRREFAPAATALFFFGLISSAPNGSLAGDGHWEGYDAFKSGDFEKAITAYETELSHNPSLKDTARLRFAMGSAAYRQGDFERASDEFGQALTNNDSGLQEQSHYNLGNTLFRKGQTALQGKTNNPDQPQPAATGKDQIKATIQQWESAIEHYESALALNQKNENAAHNINIVKARIEELKKEQEKKEQEKKEQEEQDKEKEEQDDKEKEENKEDSKKDDQKKDEGSDKDDKQNPDQKDKDNGEKGDPDDQKDGEDKKEEEDKKNEDGSNDPEKDKQDQPQPEPEENDPKDGELKSNSDEQKQESKPNPADAVKNQQTGYSPSEARRLLDSLADETEVRPILRPVKAEKYKNW